MATPRHRRPATRSRLTALGLSAAAFAGLVAGMVATAKPRSPAATSNPSAEPGGGPAGAPTVPFAGRPAITQTGAS